MSIVGIIALVIAVASLIIKVVLYNRGPKIVVPIGLSPFRRVILLVVVLLLLVALTLSLPGMSG